MKRRNYFILKQMQTRFIFTLVMIGLLVAAVLAVNIYFFHRHFATEILSLGDDSRLDDIITRAWDIFHFRLILLALSAGIITVILAILFSHQIAGPIYKVVKSVEEIREGKLYGFIKLRKHDELVEVAESLNLLVDRYREKIIEVNDIAKLIQGEKGDELRQKLAYFRLEEGKEFE